MTDSDDGKRVRVQVDVSQNILKALDDYRLQARLPDRAAAVRALLQSVMAFEADADKSDN
jgi:hypothetical protein